MSTSRYLGKKMSRSLSTPLDPGVNYMTVREGNKLYRVPLVRDPTASRPRGKSVDKMDANAKKAMESTDGNWTTKTDAFRKEDNKHKQSLRLRNEAVSKMLEAEKMREKAEEMDDIQHQVDGPPINPQKPDIFLVKSKDVGPIYVKKTHKPSNRQQQPNDWSASRIVSAPKPSGKASVYVTYPVNAYSTMPRKRIQSEGHHQHVKMVYQQQPAVRSISVPTYQHVIRDTPSPTPTISQFLAEEGDIQVHNTYQPYYGTNDGYTHNSETVHRVYKPRSHDTRSKGTRVVVGQGIERSNSTPNILDNDYRGGQSAFVAVSPRDGDVRSPRHKSGGSPRRSPRHGSAGSPRHGSAGSPRNGSAESPRYVSTDVGYRTVPRNMKPVYKGRVVRVQVPGYDDERVEVVKTLYQTYPEPVTMDTVQTTSRKPTATIQIVNADTPPPTGKTSATIEVVNSETISSSPSRGQTTATVEVVQQDVNANHIKSEEKGNAKTVMRDHSPRTVVLQKGKNGFGFVLRGAKSQIHTTSTLDFIPTPDFPALQYLDRVDRGSPADRVGLKPGDFLLEINNEVVINATHEHTVRLIKQSGDTLAMKVVTVKPLPAEGSGVELHMDGTRTLPTKKKAGVAPLPPQRHPQTSLSESRGKQAALDIQGLMELEKLDATLAQYDIHTDHQMDTAAQSRGVNVKNKTASIGRHSQRMSTMPIEEIFSQSVDEPNSSDRVKPVVVIPKSYHSPRSSSVDNLERVKGTNQVEERSVTNVRLSRVPDHDRVMYGNEERVYAVPFKGGKQHYTEGNLSVHIGDKGAIPPPPSHPPPHPPAENSGDSGEIVRINTRDSHSGYSNISQEIQSRKSSPSPVESSFRPGIGARMTKEPSPKPPSVHSRDSSISSNQSSLSSHSEQRRASPAPDVHKRSPPPSEVKHPYYEPTPDYDVESPSSIRESWTNREKVSESQTNDFSNAIKAAAAARDNKIKSPPPPPSKPTQSSPSNGPTQIPPPPPIGGPPPPPPPPPPGPPPPPKPSEGPPKKAVMPVHVQRQLQENQRQEFRHAALMAAIAKRRNVVDSADMESVAQNIETRVQKSQQSKSLVFDGKNNKPEIVKAPNNAPVAPLVASLRQTRTEPRPTVVGSEKTESSENGSSKQTLDSSFTAKAEKARKEYLAKKSAPSPPSAGPTPSAAPPPPSMVNIAPVIAQRALEKQKTFEQVDSKVRGSGSGHTLLDTRIKSTANKNNNNNNNNVTARTQMFERPLPTSPQRNRVLTNGSVHKDPLEGIDIVPPPPVYDGNAQFDMPPIAPPPPPGFDDPVDPPSQFDSNRVVTHKTYTSHM